MRCLNADRMLPFVLLESAAAGFAAAAFAFFAISLSKSFPCLLLNSSIAACRSFCRILRKSKSRSFGNLSNVHTSENELIEERLMTTDNHRSNQILTCMQYIHDNVDRL